MPFVLNGETYTAMLRHLTAGESHGISLTAILEGLPAGVPVCAAAIGRDLALRQRGYGRGGRMAIERDVAHITAGVRHGLSLGSPISVVIANRDWENWREEMSPEAQPDGWDTRCSVRVPRPGHADLAGAAKYRHPDMRNILERASARETAARVAVGAICRSLLGPLGIEVLSVVAEIGGTSWAVPDDWSEDLCAAARASDVGCPDPDTARRMRLAIDAARDDGDTLGGLVEVRSWGLPPGLGSHVAADRRLDGRLAAAVMSIPAIKGVEIGMGFGVASARGSKVHDAITPAGGQWPFARASNNAGGIEGGMTNGEPLVLRAALKPIPTLLQPLPSVSLDTLASAPAHAERSDACAVPAAAIVVEAAVCFELARAALEKFGGDCLHDLKDSVERYRADRAFLWRSDGGK